MPLPQPELQIGMLHVAPVHPLLQVQVEGKEQYPLPQPEKHKGVTHVDPDHPLLHVQVFSAAQTPFAQAGEQETQLGEVVVVQEPDKYEVPLHEDTQVMQEDAPREGW